jgi:hypothetical protein
MNVLHIAVLRESGEGNSDMIKLLLHLGVDHKVSGSCHEVSSYIL